MNSFNAFFKVIIGIALVISISACTTPKQSKEDYSTSTNKGTTEYDEYSAQWSTKEPIGDEMKEKILSMVNNKKKADKLIKTTYSEDFLDESMHIAYNIAEIFEMMPPECIRLTDNGDIVYFVYKSNKGKYAIRMYSFKENLEYVNGHYYGKTIVLEDLKKLKNSREVEEYDPTGNYTSLYSGVYLGLYSFHYTDEGELVRIDYNSDGGTISNITVFSGKDNPLYYNLLPIDKAMLTE